MEALLAVGRAGAWMPVLVIMAMLAAGAAACARWFRALAAVTILPFQQGGGVC